MNFFDNINDFFNFKDSDTTGYNELVKQRGKIKKNLSEQLKKQLYMKDEEIKAVISLIEDYEKEIDNAKNKFNPEIHSTEQADKMYEELTEIQKRMIADVRGIIRFIMKEKLKKANLLFGDRKNH